MRKYERDADGEDWHDGLMELLVGDLNRRYSSRGVMRKVETTSACLASGWTT
jgi:hypothetical protein